MESTKMEPTFRSTQVLKEEAEDIGLQGKDIVEYLTRQQTLGREERMDLRDIQKRQAEDKKMQVRAESEEKRRAGEIHIA